jgi:hypothetical protein
VFQPPLPSHPIRGFVDKQFTTVLHIIGLIWECPWGCPCLGLNCRSLN